MPDGVDRGVSRESAEKNTMTDSSTLERLSAKLLQAEELIRSARADIEELRKEELQDSQPADPRGFLVPSIPADLRKRLAAEVFASLGIERKEPIGALALQEMSRQFNLEPNELSRDLIRMREE